MITTADTKTTEISTVDALWVLIQSQSKRVRQALTKRLIAEQAKQKSPRNTDITQTAGYKAAMGDVKHGRVYHADSVDDMMKQILG